MTRKAIVAQPLLNGTPLPDFELPGLDDRPVTLADIRGPKGTVIAFIHATWCPYCVRQLLRLNKAAPTLQAEGVGVACISHDPLSAIFAYEKTVQPPLRYLLLADSEPSLGHTFGIFDPDHETPYPAVFFAGPDDKILYVDVSSDPDCFPNMERLLEVVQYGSEHLGEP
jgi:peroxiredoxin